MKSKKIPKSFATHDGTFHADEVSACALLSLFQLVDIDRIIRSRDIELLQTCEYICDVGGIYDPKKKLFDHHQSDYQGMLSSAGMVLLYLKDKKYLTQNEYNYFNESLIHGVDGFDNGVMPKIQGWCSYSEIIANFLPITHEASPETLELAFLEAVKFAKSHLRRLRARYQYIQSCKDLVENAMKDGINCLYFEKNIPWQDLFFELGGEKHPAKFIIMPSGQHWKLRGIPPSREDRMSVRMPLPKEWLGLNNQELKDASGIPGAIFCHKGRFISIWKTRKDAIEALNYCFKHKKDSK